MSVKNVRIYLDDAHVTDEGEEVEEGRLDAVVEVAAAPRLTPGRPAALEGLVGLIQAEEKSVVHIILRHTTGHTQGGRRSRGQVTVIQPEDISRLQRTVLPEYVGIPWDLGEFCVGDGAGSLDIDMDGVILRLAGHGAASGTVTPLALAADVLAAVISLGGAPGLVVISVHQDTRIILHILK